MPATYNEIIFNGLNLKVEAGMGPGFCECQFCATINRATWGNLPGKGEPSDVDPAPDPEC
jgi:hypothetical protein